MAQYSSVKTGTTISVTNGSGVVTGDGTKWTDNISPGDALIVASIGVIYDIASVDSDTQITLTSAYQGSSGSGLQYTIHRDFTVPDNIPELNNGDIETGTIVKRLAKTIQKKINSMAGLSFDGYWTTGESYVKGSVVIHMDGVYKVFVANAATSSEPPSADWDVLFDSLSIALSDATPEPLGAPSPGTSQDVSRADHVHAMPSAADVGALSSTATTTDVPEESPFRYYTTERESNLVSLIISIYEMGYNNQSLHLDFINGAYAILE